MVFKHVTRFAAVAMLAIVMGACSSSNKSDDDEMFDESFGDEIPEETADDAGTDALPDESAETGDIAEADAGMDQAPAADEFGTEPSMPDMSTPAVTPGSGQYVNYTVRPGDTLMKIAFETYGNLYDWKRIFAANQGKLTDPNSIPAGTVIKVEAPAGAVNISRNGETYRIQPGDTLGTISQAVYGTSSKWRKIWKNNPEMIKDPNKIYAGFQLYYVPEEPMMGSSPMAGGGMPQAQPMQQAPGMDSGAVDGGAGAAQPGGMRQPASGAAQ